MKLELTFTAASGVLLLRACPALPEKVWEACSASLPVDAFYLADVAIAGGLADAQYLSYLLHGLSTRYEEGAESLPTHTLCLCLIRKTRVL